MRELAVLVERELSRKLERLTAGRQPVLDGIRAELLDAIAAAMVQDGRMRELLSGWPAVAARETWWTHWRVRRRIASALRQLQFAIRRYDRSSTRLVRTAAAIARDADAVIAEECSMIVAYDPTYRFRVVEPGALATLRRWAGGALPPELRLFAYRPARPAPTLRPAS